MTDKQQPDALELADICEDESRSNPDDYRWKAAAYLRSQHAELETLTLYKNMADEYGLSIFPDIAEMTAELETLRAKLTGFDLPSGRHALFTSPQPTQAQAGAVPLTPERVKEIVLDAGYDQCDIPDSERAAFIDGLRHGEEAHGIKGGQHGNE